MSFQGCLDVKNRMLKEGYANLETEFVITHFSHNGTLTHKETKTWAQSNGFTAAYDGIVLNIK